MTAAAAKAAMIICLLYALKQKSKIHLHLLFLILGVSYFTFSETIRVYASLTAILPETPFIRIFAIVLTAIGKIVLTINLLIYGLSLSDVIPKIRPLIFLGTGVVILLNISAIVLQNPAIPEMISEILLSLSFLAFFTLNILHWIRKQPKQTTIFKILFFAMAALSFPMIIAEASRYSLFALLYVFLLSVSAAILVIFNSRKPSPINQQQMMARLTEACGISEREAEVASLLLSGLSAKDIAQKLYISVKTVQNHTASIYSKTGVNSRYQLIQQVNTAIGKIP